MQALLLILLSFAQEPGCDCDWSASCPDDPDPPWQVYETDLECLAAKQVAWGWPITMIGRRCDLCIEDAQEELDQALEECGDDPVCAAEAGVAFSEAVAACQLTASTTCAVIKTLADADTKADCCTLLTLVQPATPEEQARWSANTRAHPQLAVVLGLDQLGTLQAAHPFDR